MAPRGRRGRPAVSQDRPLVADSVEAPVEHEIPSGEGEATGSGPAAAPGARPTPEIPVALTAPTRDARVVDEMLRTFQTMAAAFSQGAVPRAEQTPATSTAHDLRDFLRLAPPVFRGAPEPSAAEHCLARVTRCLDTSGITNGGTRVSFAVHLLEGDAYHWWERVRARVGTDYEAFRTVFLDSFFLEAVREARRQSFVDLHQGSLSVAQYEARFTALARFAPEMVATETLLCKRFERGLRPAIVERLVAMRICVYTDLVDAAMAVGR